MAGTLRTLFGTSVALLGPHGSNQGGFSGISEQESSAALFKGSQAPVQSGPAHRAVPLSLLSARVCVCVGEGRVRWVGGGGGGLALRKDSLNTLGSLKEKKPLGCRSGGCRCIVPAQRRRSQPRARLRRTWYLSIHCAHH